MAENEEYSNDIFQNKIMELLKIKQEILMAFIAKYSIQPDKIVIVTTKGSDENGFHEAWHIRSKDDFICKNCHKELNFSL